MKQTINEITNNIQLHQITFTYHKKSFNYSKQWLIAVNNIEL
jgi:hypothetical protein